MENIAYKAIYITKQHLKPRFDELFRRTHKGFHIPKHRPKLNAIQISYSTKTVIDRDTHNILHQIQIRR